MDELPKRAVVAMVTTLVGDERAAALDATRVLLEVEVVLPDVGWMVPARISYRPFPIRYGSKFRTVEKRFFPFIPAKPEC